MRPQIIVPRMAKKKEDDESVIINPTNPVTPDIEDVGEMSTIEWEENEKTPSELLSNLKKGYILSATDFSSQIWCEEQVRLQAIHGRAPTNVAMLKGTARHEVLELADHDIKEVIIETREEGLAFRMLNSMTLIKKMLFTGDTRELWILGKISMTSAGAGAHNLKYGNNYITGVRGVIDELKLVGKKINTCYMPTDLDDPEKWKALWRKHGTYLLIGDTKTRREETEPSQAQKLTSAIQLQTYHLILEQLRLNKASPHELIELYRVNQCEVMDHPELMALKGLTIEEITIKFLTAFQCLPPLVDYAEVAYDCQGKEFKRDQIPCSDEIIVNQLEYLVGYWTGARTQPDIPGGYEKWKCKWCYYLPYCDKTPLVDDEYKQAIVMRTERIKSDELDIKAYNDSLNDAGKTIEMEAPSVEVKTPVSSVESMNEQKPTDLIKSTTNCGAQRRRLGSKARSRMVRPF